jgi:hypothetical protein
VLPNDPESFLSTSPWQIMDFNSTRNEKEINLGSFYDA